MAKKNTTARSDREAPPPRPPGQGQRRGKGPRAIADSVARLTAPIFRERGVAEATIVTEWRHIAGDIAAHSLPLRLSFAGRQRRDGTLEVRVESSWALEAQHLTPQIIERLNTYFGYRAVGRLRLVQGPLPTTPRPQTRRPQPATGPLSPAAQATIEAQTAAVQDPDLRQILRRLGAALHRRKGSPGTPTNQ